MAAPKILQISATSVAIDGASVSTVFALLDNNEVICTGYPGKTDGWIRLPPTTMIAEQTEEPEES